MWILGEMKFADIKVKLAVALAKIYILDLLVKLQYLFYPKHIRSINYHDLGPCSVENFEQQMIFFQKNYHVLGINEIEEYFINKEITKPGLLITFDDGLRSHYVYAHTILKKYNIPGIFMVPGGFIDSEDSHYFAEKNTIEYFPNSEERISMNWDEVIEISKHHDICSHTWNHVRLSDRVPEDELVEEIINSKKNLEDKINREIKGFCWVGGEEYTYSANAYNKIIKAEYSYVFTSNNSPTFMKSDLHFINRHNIEANYPIELVKFQLSGVMDLLYINKRRRIKKRLKIA